MNNTLIGHCRHCNAPILHPSGATCTHRGFLIWTAVTRFYQGEDGRYDHWATMQLDYPPEPTNHQAANTADLIADMLAHPL